MQIQRSHYISPPQTTADNKNSLKANKTHPTTTMVDDISRAKTASVNLKKLKRGISVNSRLLLEYSRKLLPWMVYYSNEAFGAGSLGQFDELACPRPTWTGGRNTDRKPGHESTPLLPGLRFPRSPLSSGRCGASVLVWLDHRGLGLGALPMASMYYGQNLFAWEKYSLCTSPCGFPLTIILEIGFY